MDALKWLLELDPSALCVALLVATLAGVWLYVMSTKPRPPSPEVLSLLTDTKGLPLGKRLNPKGKSKAKQVEASQKRVPTAPTKSADRKETPQTSAATAPPASKPGSAKEEEPEKAASSVVKGKQGGKGRGKKTDQSGKEKTTDKPADVEEKGEWQTQVSRRALRKKQKQEKRKPSSQTTATATATATANGSSSSSSSSSDTRVKSSPNSEEEANGPSKALLKAVTTETKRERDKAGQSDTEQHQSDQEADKEQRQSDQEADKERQSDQEADKEQRQSDQEADKEQRQSDQEADKERQSDQEADKERQSDQEADKERQREGGGGAGEGRQVVMVTADVVGTAVSDVEQALHDAAAAGSTSSTPEFTTDSKVPQSHDQSHDQDTEPWVVVSSDPDAGSHELKL